ncbi:PAS domain-containing protein [Qipengyuania qiaonensis]|uniref:histidine kinase n=1 Tax=Qipengyuania qiaonensis TaxID=2867240 RepID=A0ABS7J0Q9_9SPHN|nr:PAS domain-containing protein [Qipengyuania qiaonensis]MBX7480940.1 PAS domain S-box protein [Qipengyuania qiaonensis]
MNMDVQSGLLGFVGGIIAVSLLMAIWLRVRAYGSSQVAASPVMPDGQEAGEKVQSPFYAELMDAAPDMLIVIGPDRVRRYISPSCERLLGYSPEQMIGQPPVNGIHPEDRAAAMEASERLFRGEVVSALTTYRHRHADGHYVWLEANFAPRWSAAGELRDFVGVVRDIGERRREEMLKTARNARLRENNRLLQMAEKIANIGHWRVDVKEGTLIWSDQVYRIHGMPADYVPDVAKGLDFYHEEDRDMVSKMVERAFSDGEGFEFRARIIRANGELRHVASVGHAEKSPTGEVITVFGVFKDITETVGAEERLRQSRDEAERASQAKAHFLANMSHEIRTPMNGVIGFADLLLESDLSAEHHEYVRMISDSGKAMLRLLNELLDMSKIEAGRMQLSREPVDYGHLVRSSVRLFEPNAKAKGISLEMDIAPDLPEGIGDKLRVRQIILNLVGNAIKFTEQGAVRIEAGKSKDTVLIRVIDDGPGIAEDQLSYIFEEFTQLQSGSSDAYRGVGTGLGLAIARQLAELMDGQLDVTSKLGEGSIFELRLPLIECSAEQPMAAVNSRDAASFREILGGKRVLLAEDADINRKLAMTMLSRLGVLVEAAENGKEAVDMVHDARAQGNPFHAVLMDMQMPIMDGLDATRTLRADGIPARELPIIALTANAYADDIELCRAAGMQDHLAKPISIERLGLSLENWLMDQAPKTQPEADEPAAEIDEARKMYEDRKAALHRLLTSLDESSLADPRQIEDLREQLHVMAGIAAHFDDADLGDRARIADRSLKIESDPKAVMRDLDAVRVWFTK